MSTQQVEIPIHRLKSGSKAVVSSLSGNATEVARISAMGIREGVELCSLRRGMPCIVKCGCSKICLRTSEDLKVMVYES